VGGGCSRQEAVGLVDRIGSRALHGDDLRWQDLNIYHVEGGRALDGGGGGG
jgi:hypothetical protein